MPGRSWRDDEPVLRKLAADGLDPESIAARLGRTYNAVRMYAAQEGIRLPPRVMQGQPRPAPDRPPATEELEIEGGEDDQTIRSHSARITSPEQLLRKANVDPATWEVYWQRVKQYEGYLKNNEGEPVVVPMFSVEVKVRRNRKACLLRSVGDAIVADIEARRPEWPVSAAVVLPRSAERHLFEVCMMDLHVGKLAWAEETGEDYDISIAEEVFRDALETLIQGVQGRCVERILFPIGNDLLQIDNLTNSTTGGTPQDTDTRYAKMYARAEGMMRYALERLSQIAPVTAPVVPGNHDRQSALSLGRTLRAWFHANDRVTIDASPRLRKYHRYGVNLIGYTHGSEEKHADLPLIMAQECGTDWAETFFREFHVGHLHKSKETRYTAGDTFNGVRVRIIPSLCAVDAWHSMKGYVGGIRSAEAYLWNHDTGYAGHVSANVIPDRKAA